MLIKDNHVAAAGGVREAIERARAYAPHSTRIECEVDTPKQLDVAVAAGAEVILLDNFDPVGLREAVRALDEHPRRAQFELEASGGIDLDTIEWAAH